MGGISFFQIAVIVVVVAVVFGGGRLRNLGSDLGTSIKGFKKAMKDEPANLEHKGDENDATFKEETASRVEEKEKV